MIKTFWNTDFLKRNINILSLDGVNVHDDSITITFERENEVVYRPTEMLVEAKVEKALKDRLAYLEKEVIETVTYSFNKHCNVLNCIHRIDKYNNSIEKKYDDLIAKKMAAYMQTVKHEFKCQLSTTYDDSLKSITFKAKFPDSYKYEVNFTLYSYDDEILFDKGVDEFVKFIYEKLYGGKNK